MPRLAVPEDLLRLRLVSDAQVSPDGRQVVYVLTEVDGERDGYRSRLVRVGPDGEEVPLTRGEARDTHPRWSPDGRHIAFLSDRGGSRQLWVMRADGGEPWRLTDLPHPPASPAWAPDGTRLAFVAPVARPDPADALFGFPSPDPRRVRVTADLHYKLDGVGFLGPLRRQVFVVDLEGRVRQLTDEDLDFGHPAWSPDGRLLAVDGTPRQREAGPLVHPDLYLVPLDGGAPRRLTAGPGPCAMPAWSPDGRWLACFGHDDRAHAATNVGIRLVPAAGGEPVELLAGFDRSVGNHVRSYERGGPGETPPLWTPDGRRIYFIATDGGEQPVFYVDVAERRVVRVGPGRRRVVPSCSLSADGRRLACVVETATSVGEVYLCDLAADGTVAREVRLTRANAALEAEVAFLEPERIEVESEPGWRIEGWLLRPPGASPERPAPLILNIHGGPHGTWGYTLMLENQVLAGAGYAVLYVNPRGSQGYGERFTAAVVDDWGGGDFRDLMACVDWVVEHCPWVDAGRLGVMGNSYGGFMTNWILGHTDRFRAGVTQGTISNRHSFFGTSDFGFYRGLRHQDLTPWQQPERLWAISPLAYAERIRAPLLFLHGEQDDRCPIEQAEQLYVALKLRGVPTAFVRYAGESHGFTRTGRPSHRVDRLRRHLAWFDRFVRGAEPGTTGAAALRAAVPAAHGGGGDAPGPGAPSGGAGA